MMALFASLSLRQTSMPKLTLNTVNVKLVVEPFIIAPFSQIIV